MKTATPALPRNLTLAANALVSQRLPSALALKQQLPLSCALGTQVNTHRQAVRAILDGHDPRLLVIVGPCSLHDAKSALEYAARLARLAQEVSGEMLLVMRAYVEKPRTTVGWKGLAYDPRLDGSDDMVGGLTLCRELMLAMLGLGLPIASELLQPMAAGYFDDLLSWVAIGARTTESQIHREMASGLGMPVGFKNGTDGGVGVACDAMRSAAHGHRHFGIDPQGHPAIIETAGNPDTHLVLRGGHHGPNHDRQSIAKVHHALGRAAIPARIMVDCSHANSGKDPSRQPHVFEDVLNQRLEGDRSLIGMMIEGHLFDGCQAPGPNLRYGVSVTDGCLGWDSTEQLLREAARRMQRNPSARAI
ncbi:3-deoxy-7-phosphoheptulonate synthase [Pseudomonas sp. dw_358]|uniref:3-deoxy-7-phosphoheptulonate synthase n=1 Tax=Pseudomonas sp. dw_358 TaxID=2720083 RepID=UPI001BD26D7B|nr:3-deoxy-7-phosphoheptulonate synthase [Pseudomonas sp. dw_358]